uniref:Uncharacterized protein n=1 Tax=Mycena chlorophos TaxID=658473 RepID=A0ABQ0M3I8_MYCCL|nr:predicted protein [Mycena chlorophos]
MMLLYDRLGECEDSECLRLLVRAAAKMGNARYQPGYTFSWALEAPSPQCLTPAECRESRMDAIREVTKRVHVVGYLPSSALVKWAAKRFPHCQRCAEDARVSAVAGRAKAWDDLPSMFGLPSWDELNASTEIAFSPVRVVRSTNLDSSHHWGQHRWRPMLDKIPGLCRRSQTKRLRLQPRDLLGLQRRSKTGL